MRPFDRSAVDPVLASIARGIIGPESYSPEMVGYMHTTLANLASDAQFKQLCGILTALNTKPGALALTGRPTPVSWLRADEAEAMIQRWKSSKLEVRRTFASLLISLVMSARYGRPSPEWERIGFPGPPGPPPEVPKKLEPLQIDSDETLYCDVVIVGSGAGGGCAAAVLAEAGLDVVVLEKGGYSNESDFTQYESEAHNQMYLYGGTFMTADQGIRLFAGSTLGGGTVINWATSWKTPEPVLREWAQVSGVDAFVSGEIEESLDAVCARLNVNVDSSASWKRDELMEDGLKRLGWHVDTMPRNVMGCSQDEACGFCTYGCRIGAKKSSLNTYLEDAAGQGARMVVGADVRNVMIRDDRARGVEARVGRHTLKVEARAVIAAGGALETPALLLRSGMGGQVGRNLRLHPATALVGIFDDYVAPWGGVNQARYSNQLDGPFTGGYGPTIESGPAAPASFATITPWTSAARHRELMTDYPHASLVGFPSRERGSGRVKIERSGVPKVIYKIPRDDEKRIAEGVVAAGKVLEAAGARKIFTFHQDPIAYEPKGPSAHERWAEETRARGYRNRQLTFFSMHQMGSCRMGVDPSTSAVGADNESHDVKNLYVMDGSTFPTPSGVNPMISIYGIAHRAAKKLAHHLS